LIGQAFSVLGSYWLQYWGTTSVRHDKSRDALTSSENLWFLQIFAALACASLLAYVMRSLLLANHRLGTSVTFHERLLESTLYAPIAFFDTTPTGRILNRFSSDMLSVDEEISQTLSQASNSFAQVIGAFGAIVGATKGTFLLVMVPLAYFYYQVQRYFRNTNTTIARLESISRSPIYADFSQALAGLPSIRAFRDSPRFIQKLEKAVNHNSIANISTQLCSQWLALRLDFMGALVSFFIVAIAAATSSSDFIPAGFVAVGLTYSFQLTTYLKFMIRMIASGEAQTSSACSSRP
jgi:ATP-binding cassette subfamily C (CFTR/MRP) protein 1